MADEPYSKRESDIMYLGTNSNIDALRDEVREGFAGIHKRQDEANHKVRKIIMALTLAFGLILGLGAQNMPLLISILL